jgi:hypothetical protein
MWYITAGCLVMFTFTFFTAPLIAEAQPTGKVYRIGRLTEGVLSVTALLEALRGLGYVDGHNLVLEHDTRRRESNSLPWRPSWWLSRWTSS